MCSTSSTTPRTVILTKPCRSSTLSHPQLVLQTVPPSHLCSGTETWFRKTHLISLRIWTQLQFSQYRGTKTPKTVLLVRRGIVERCPSRCLATLLTAAGIMLCSANETTVPEMLVTVSGNQRGSAPRVALFVSATQRARPGPQRFDTCDSQCAVPAQLAESLFLLVFAEAIYAMHSWQ